MFLTFIQNSCCWNVSLQSRCPLWNKLHPRIYCVHGLFWVACALTHNQEMAYVLTEIFRSWRKTDTKQTALPKDDSQIILFTHSELVDKQICPQRVSHVPEDTGWWQISQTPCILFYLSPLQSSYHVDLEGLLELQTISRSHLFLYWYLHKLYAFFQILLCVSII